MAGRLTRSARQLTLHLPQRWPWENQFSRALARFRALLSRPDDARPPLTQPPRQLVPSRPRVRLAVSYPAISLTTAIAGRHRRPQ